MDRFAVDRSPVKSGSAWLLEKAGRLKLNGQLRGYSPLSRLVELEALESGVAGKRSLWETLSDAFPEDLRLSGIDLGALADRAERQLDEIGEYRRGIGRPALVEA